MNSETAEKEKKSKVKPRMAQNQLLRALRQTCRCSQITKKNNPKVGSTIILLYISTLLKFCCCITVNMTLSSRSQLHINSQCWSTSLLSTSLSTRHQRSHFSLSLACRHFIPLAFLISAFHDCNSAAVSSGCQSRMCVSCPGSC